MEDNEKKERKDYCGAFWMPKWLRIKLSKKFNASCKMHDLDYDAHEKYSQKEADDRFLKSMLRQANRLENKTMWRCIAKVYYIFVRIGGWYSYSEAKKKG